MKNDIFDITWSAEANGDKVKIYFRLENNNPVAYLEVDDYTDKFDECMVMGFVMGIATYLLLFKFGNKEYSISGSVIDPLTMVPATINNPKNIALSNAARLLFHRPDGQNIEFKKHVKKMTKLSEIAMVQVGKKLTPIHGGLARYIESQDSIFNSRDMLCVNEVMVDDEHAVFFGISKDNIDFYTYCDDGDGRYCAAENIAVLTNIESRFDKPWILDEIREQVLKLLNESGGQVLTLEQVKNIELDDEKYRIKKQLLVSENGDEIEFII